MHHTLGKQQPYLKAPSGGPLAQLPLFSHNVWKRIIRKNSVENC
jgi:hypothetical protein